MERQGTSQLADMSKTICTLSRPTLGLLGPHLRDDELAISVPAIQLQDQWWCQRESGEVGPKERCRALGLLYGCDTVGPERYVKTVTM